MVQWYDQTTFANTRVRATLEVRSGKKKGVTWSKLFRRTEGGRPGNETRDNFVNRDARFGRGGDLNSFYRPDTSAHLGMRSRITAYDQPKATLSWPIRPTGSSWPIFLRPRPSSAEFLWSSGWSLASSKDVRSTSEYMKGKHLHRQHVFWRGKRKVKTKIKPFLVRFLIAIPKYISTTDNRGFFQTRAKKLELGFEPNTRFTTDHVYKEINVCVCSKVKRIIPRRCHSSAHTSSQQ